MIFIFNYHFSQRENIEKAQNELKFDKLFSFNPIINYDGNKEYLTFELSKTDKSNKLKIEIKNANKIETQKLINVFFFEYVVLKQKRLQLFKV